MTPTLTTTFSVVAPGGTVTWMKVSLQEIEVAVTPLNVTVLLPCVAPKFDPKIETDEPIGPAVGDSERTLGTTPTVKFTGLLADPPTVTTTFPVVAELGTGTPIKLGFQ